MNTNRNTWRRWLRWLPVAAWMRKLMVRVHMRMKTYEILLAGWLTLCFALCVIFLVGQTYNPFIYFQF